MLPPILQTRSTEFLIDVLPMAFARYFYRGDSFSPQYPMLETLAVILVILWLLGLLTSYTLGGLIHLLLVIAIIAIIFRLISGRSAI
jgi:hypothetical protein